MPNISSLSARQILDSRGNPTIEVDCELEDGSIGRGSVPSGVSAGVHEALELRDGDKSVYRGKGVLKAVENVEGTILDVLKGQPVADHRTIDQMMLDLDGTPNKANLGANAILGVSLAVSRARAASEGRPLWQSLADQYGQESPVTLPLPMAVLIEAGVHSDGGLAFQEFMVMPTGFASFSDGLRAVAEVFHVLNGLLKQGGHVTAVGVEGACAPRLSTADEAFGLLMQAIDGAGYSGKMKLALDAAASEFVNDDGTYALDGNTLSSEEMTAVYENLCRDYPLVSIEDSHGEEDWDGFVAMKKTLGDTVQLVGDDLLVTNVERIEKAKELDAANAVLIKVNQIGSVSETVDAILTTKEYRWNPVVSHRGGDTEDSFIADLAVALNAGQIKTGSVTRGERTAKYNQLIRIEDALGSQAQYQSEIQ